MNKEQRSLDRMILNLIFDAMKALSPDAFDALLTVVQTTGEAACCVDISRLRPPGGAP